MDERKALAGKILLDALKALLVAEKFDDDDARLVLARSDAQDAILLAELYGVGEK